MDEDYNEKYIELLDLIHTACNQSLYEPQIIITVLCVYVANVISQQSHPEGAYTEFMERVQHYVDLLEMKILKDAKRD